MKYVSTIVIIVLICIFCISSYLWNPQNKISNLEMRTLATFGTIFHPSRDSIIYKKTFIERLEQSLKDQFVFRNVIVKKISVLKAKLSNIYDSTINCVYCLNGKTQKTYQEYEHPKLEPFTKQQYSLSKIGDFYRINNTNYLCEAPSPKPHDLQTISYHVSQLNHIQKLYPDIKIYSYLVTSIDMTQWFDSYLGITTPDHLEQIAQAHTDNIKVKRLIYKDFEEYKDLFFASDHHANYKGSYKTYLDIYDMISKDFALSEQKKPVKEWNFTDLLNIKYHGSRAQRLKKEYNGWDNFIVFEYDLGNRQTCVLNPKTLKETPAVLSLFEKYKRGKLLADMYHDHYVHFYGDAILEDGVHVDDQNYIYIIRNNTKTGHNLLFITDSSGRAIRDVLGTHFDTFVYLDFRIISKIDIDYLINKYKTDIILINGFYDVWINDEFVFRFSENSYTKEKD